MSFESRIERRRQLIESERQREQQRIDAEETDKKRQEEQARAHRLQEIKNDPRFIQMIEIAESPELREALDEITVRLGNYRSPQKSEETYEGTIFRRKVKTWKPGVKIPGEISISHDLNYRKEIRPLGTIIVKAKLSDEDRHDTGVTPERSIKIEIAWRDVSEKREYTQGKPSFTPRMYSGGGYYSGVSAEVGLGMSVHLEGSEIEWFLPVFYSLESLLDYLAEILIKRRK